MMFETDGLAKHIQLRTHLKQTILEGTLAVGTRLRPERDLMEEYGVSRNTLRQALDALQHEGLLCRERGRGTFVCAAPAVDAAGVRKGGADVGILMDALDRDFRTNLIRGIDDVLGPAGMHMTVTLYHTDANDENERLQSLLAKGVAGLIVFPSYKSAGSVPYSRIAAEIPLVFVDCAVQGVETDVVLTDDAGLAYRGTQALIAQGCKRIAYLGGYSSAWTSRERYSGYRRALAEAGLTAEAGLIFEGPFSHDFGYRTMRRLIETGKPFDGLFIANHPITEGVARALLRQRPDGLGQVRICSFGDEDFGLRCPLPLIVACQPVLDMGRQAARRVLERLAASGKGSDALPAEEKVVEGFLSFPDESVGDTLVAPQTRRVNKKAGMK